MTPPPGRGGQRPSGAADSPHNREQSLVTSHPCRPRQSRNFHPSSNQLPPIVSHQHLAARTRRSASLSDHGCRCCEASLVQATHYAKHTYGAIAASKQVDCERNVSLRGKTTANIFHVLIEAKYLVDNDNTRKRPISLWTCHVSLELATARLKRSHLRYLCHNYYSPESKSIHLHRSIHYTSTSRVGTDAQESVRRRHAGANGS